MSIKHDIEVWVEQYTEPLYEWAFYKLGDRETAKDLVQETFLAACQRADAFEGKSNPKTWLISILNHKIVDQYRKRAHSPADHAAGDTLFFDGDDMWKDETRPGKWDTDKNLLDDEAFNKVLRECIGKLPGQWEAVIRLKYLWDKSSGEVCKELDITATNYWQMIHRAKLSLRQCLETNWFK